MPEAARFHAGFWRERSAVFIFLTWPWHALSYRAEQTIGPMVVPHKGWSGNRAEQAARTRSVLVNNLQPTDLRPAAQARHCVPAVTARSFHAQSSADDPGRSLLTKYAPAIDLGGADNRHDNLVALPELVVKHQRAS